MIFAPNEYIVSQPSLQELGNRHSDGKLHTLEILVSTKTIRHDKADTSSAKTSEKIRKVIWLLALFVDENEKDKISRSFRLGTRFDVVEGEIFISFEVV
jgi:hypothetical protein